MKKIYSNLLIIFLFVTKVSAQEIYFSQNFESINLPTGWTMEKVTGNVDWKTYDGGYSPSPTMPGTGNPPYAYQGLYNAYFQYNSLSNEKTKLITPPIDLKYGIRPELRFWHAMDERYFFFDNRHDELRVYYKKSATDAWVLLETYTEIVSNWTERFINLPFSDLSSTFYIAFEGKNSGGAGVCIDSVTIVETGKIPMYVESVIVNQASVEQVPTESMNNPILRIDFVIQGNDGSIKLDSIGFLSLNATDNDITTSGVKLFGSKDTLFRNSQQIGINNNFIDGKVNFSNLNFEFKRGISAVWLTYDIKKDENHNMQGHILDAKVQANGIKINQNYYPSVDKSPYGSRKIIESIFFDNFESDKNWIYTGEFQRSSPLGLGGGIGYPDPTFAVSGSIVIGTDLTGLGANKGNYENNLSDREYSAISQSINARYYREINLHFWKWLNMDGYDNASIDISIDNESTWSKIYESINSVVTDSKWRYTKYNINNLAQDKESIKIRFAIGITNPTTVFSGWNIDDFFITGDFLTVDASVLDVLTPITSCGHSSAEPIKVVIRNYAGMPTNDTIPVFYSTNGGITKIYDTLFVSIPIDGIDTLTLNKKINLSTPGTYSLMVSVDLAGDEVPANNTFTKSLYAIPTYKLPYSQTFETNNGHWRSLGKGSWQYGKPTTGNINNAASGQYAWITKINANYPNSDSSILESPCFDFSGVNYPVFEFKIRSYTVLNDGMNVYYSIDNGNNWSMIPEEADYYWKWYNKSFVGALGTAGWDTTTTNWYTVRKLLPSEIANESNVKFRFLFKSNSELNDAGIGIDDIKIYEAPYDVGVTKLLYPYSKCELTDTTAFKVYIENYGLDSIRRGTKIPVRLIVNNNTIATDTLTLTTPLLKNDSILFTFPIKVNMVNAGDYSIKLLTKLESNTYFYNDTLSNDSLITIVSVLGMPDYNPFNDVTGVAAFPSSLDAGGGFTSYLWQDNSTTTQTFNVTVSDNYKVTVTNGFGCTASDSTYVTESLIELALDTVLTVLKDSCERVNQTELVAVILNQGLDDFDIGDTIFMAYKVNSDAVVKDTLILTKALTRTAPNDTIKFTFKEKADLTTPGAYKLSVYTNFLNDLDHRNDSVTNTINTWGFPDVELEFDSISSSNADTLLLIATPGYDTYSWNTNPLNTTNTLVPNNVSRWYVVTAYDEHSCGFDKDSTYVNTYDYGKTGITSPADSCVHSTTTPIEISIFNYSGNIYVPGDTIKFQYNFNDNGWIAETYTLTSIFDPNTEKTITLNGTIDPSAVGDYTFSIFTESDIDANHTNDTINTTFSTWGYPSVSLPFDTIYTTQADTIVLIPTLGYNTYSWNTGSTNDTLEITELYSKNYVVTVTDVHGCGSSKDSTQVITYNLEVTALNTPINSCSHTANETVGITIQNSSQDTYSSGTSFNVTYILNNNAPVTEVKTLTSNLLPFATTTFSFLQKADLSSNGIYFIKAYIDLELDVDRENDTIYEGIKTLGYPIVEIGPDIYTHQPDTVTLIANPGYNNYSWNEGTKNDTLLVTKPESFEYKVLVSDIYGCSSRDSLKIYTTNVAASTLISPVSACEWSNSEPVIVEVLNTCSDTLKIGESIAVSYKVGTGSLVTENHILTTDLLPNSTIEHTFAGKLDLTSAGDYDFKLFAKTAIDVYLNDTLSVNIIESGYPVIDLGDDLFLVNPVGTVITAPAGFDSYLWQDGSINSTFTISYPASAEYKVIVGNEFGCTTTDSINVYTYNVYASDLISPISKCELTNTEQITIGVINNSQDTLYVGEPVNATFILNGGTPVNETFNLTEDLYPDSVVEYTFTQTANMLANQLHSFKLFAKLANIDVSTDDTLTTSVDVQKPDLDLGADVNTSQDDYTIDAGSGYSSYLWFNDWTLQTYTINVNNQTANFYYSVTVTNSFGCSATDSILVTFNVSPDLSLTDLLSPQADCLSDSLYFVDVEITNSGGLDLAANNTIVVSYTIDNGSVITENHVLASALFAGNTVVHRFANTVSLTTAKIYQFKIYLSYTGDLTPANDTLEEAVLINSPSFAFSSDTLKTNSFPVVLDPGLWTTYLWQNGSTNRQFTVSSDGWYKVTVTDGFGCEATDSIYVMLNVGIDGKIYGENFTLSYYPNPVRDQLNIVIEAYRPINLDIELLNTQGQKVFNKRIKNAEQMIEKLNVGNYAKGVYYLRFISGKEMFVRKVVLQ